MKCPRCKRGTLRWVRVDVDAGAGLLPDESFEYAECRRCDWVSKAVRVDMQLTMEGL